MQPEMKIKSYVNEADLAGSHSLIVCPFQQISAGDTWPFPTGWTVALAPTSGPISVALPNALFADWCHANEVQVILASACDCLRRCLTPTCCSRGGFAKKRELVEVVRL